MDTITIVSIDNNKLTIETHVGNGEITFCNEREADFGWDVTFEKGKIYITDGKDIKFICPDTNVFVYWK